MTTDMESRAFSHGAGAGTPGPTCERDNIGTPAVSAVASRETKVEVAPAAAAGPVDRGAPDVASLTATDAASKAAAMIACSPSSRPP